MITNNLSKEEILKLVSEEQIYKYYLGDNFGINKSILVPWREKINSIPSLNLFYSSNGTLLWKDHSYSEVGNVFQFVMKFNNCNYFEALKKIQDGIGIICGNNISNKFLGNNNLYQVKQPKEIIKKETKIEYTKKEWRLNEYSWWKSQGISDFTINKFNINLADKVYINDKLKIIGSRHNPVYIYTQNERYRIYIPLNPKGRRWYGNMKSEDLQGLEFIPDNYNELILLIKSYKDNASVWENSGIKCVNKPGETYTWTKEDIDKIKIKSTNLLYLGDFDYAGIKTAQKLKREFGINPIFLSTNRFERREDYTDSILIRGVEKTKEKLKELIK
jgi:5S rRNA maturation endonuclease (ribonuclease M5)